MAADVDAEAEPGRSGIGLHLKLKLSDLLDAEGLHHDDVAVTSVPWRRSSAEEAVTSVLVTVKLGTTGKSANGSFMVESLP